MNWKTTLFAAFWIVSAALMIGLPSCKESEPKSPDQKAVTENADITLQDTVNVDSAKKQIARYDTFAKTFVGKVKDYPIVNPTVQTFQMPLVYIDYFDDLRKQGQILQGTDTVIWAMLAIETIQGKSNINLYFVNTDVKGKIHFYDVTSSTSSPMPVRLDSATARARINTYARYDSLLVQNMDTTGFCLAGLRGFQVNFTDMVQISAQRKAPDAKFLTAVLVIKPCETNPKLQTIDMYMNIELPLNGIRANGGGGNTYFDFTDPCPNSCPW